MFQAIEAAGGYLPEAALTCVNRAGVLTDGQQLYILTQEEMERQGLDPAEMAKASDGQMNGSAGTGQNTGMAAQVQQDNRININTADEAQLTTLTGIGATRAQAIIAYREENGRSLLKSFSRPSTEVRVSSRVFNSGSYCFTRASSRKASPTVSPAPSFAS